MTFVFAGVPFLLTSIVAGALAAVVFYHGPGRPVNRCLSAMLLGTAATLLPWSMAAFSGSASGDAFSSNEWNRVGDLYWSLMLLPAIPLALSWPQRRAWAPRVATSLWPWATLAMIFAVLRAWDHAHDLLGPQGELTTARATWEAVGQVAFLALLAAAILLAYEARKEATPALRDARVLMALGLGLHGVNIAARDVINFPRRVEMSAQEPLQWIVLVATPFVALAALTLAVLLWRGASSPARSAARLLLIGAAASGVLDTLLLYARLHFGLPIGYEARLFLYALWFLVPNALLGYVVLRGQIPGLDIKVRFALSRSTVAAIFIAAFFVASEGAQIVFGQGNEWVGLLGAGALVFALAPLQRAAERLAERAVPLSEDARSAPTADRTYRSMLARLSADGTLSREDERLLAHLAAELGIDARRAFEAREAVEAELGAMAAREPSGVSE